MPIHAGRVLYCDEHFLAVNKLSGELVVRGKGPVHTLPLLDFLRKQYPGLHPVHRLDFETSGVVLFARSRQALREAKGMPMRKVYRTLVFGKLPSKEAEIDLPLPARSGKGLVPATTRYRVLQSLGDVSYLEVEIETGRHHQIRKHLATVGHPLVLDAEYGDLKKNRAFARRFHYRRFFLHASRLSFPHPWMGECLTIAAPLPRVFAELLVRLRGQEGAAWGNVVCGRATRPRSDKPCP